MHDSIARYISEHYVSPETPSDGAALSQHMPGAFAALSPKAERLRERLDKLDGDLDALFDELSLELCESDRLLAEPYRDEFSGGLPESLRDEVKRMLGSIEEPFSTALLQLIDKSGLADVEVYKRANMSRQLFSRIRSDASYRPAKKTAVALCLALELNLDDARKLLERAGYALSRSSKADLIVMYFIENGRYDVNEVNEALCAFGEPML